MAKFNELDGKTAPARVAVVAAGIVSPLGTGLEETLASLRTNKDCVSAVTRFDVEKCRCKTAGQISDESLNRRGNGAETKRLHRATRMMMTAFGELFGHSILRRPKFHLVAEAGEGFFAAFDPTRQKLLNPLIYCQ